MNLNTLKPAPGSVKKGKRIGRGQGSGRGGTSTRGHKGAGSRSGTSVKAGFEGGQMPIQRRVPKYGFKNFNRVEYVPVNLDVLQKLADELKITEFNPEVLYTHGLIRKTSKVKILGNGTLSAVITISAHGFSKSAVEAIESNGGKVVKL